MTLSRRLFMRRICWDIFSSLREKKKRGKQDEFFCEISFWITVKFVSVSDRTVTFLLITHCASWKCNRVVKNSTNLVHGISEKGLERPPVAGGLVLESREKRRERRRRLLALGQHLQAVVVISHVLLVNRQHRQQHVEQVTCNIVVIEFHVSVNK